MPPGRTSAPRYSQLSYISGITADGFSWPTMAASIGRTWPLLVTMSAAPATPGVFAGMSSTRSATPASRASSVVPAASSRAAAYRVAAARACTCAPASAASTGVTAYAPVAASVSTTRPARSSSQRSMAAVISRTSRRPSRPGSPDRTVADETGLAMDPQALPAGSAAPAAARITETT